MIRLHASADEAYSLSFILFNQYNSGIIKKN